MDLSFLGRDGARPSEGNFLINILSPAYLRSCFRGSAGLRTGAGRTEPDWHSIYLSGGAEETLGLGAGLSAAGSGGGVLCKESVAGANGFCRGWFAAGGGTGASRR